MADVLKMIDLEKLYQPKQPELEAAIRQVISRSDFIHGQAVGLFLKNGLAYPGAAQIVGCGNGTDALQLALMALDLPAWKSRQAILFFPRGFSFSPSGSSW